MPCCPQSVSLFVTCRADHNDDQARGLSGLPGKAPLPLPRDRPPPVCLHVIWLSVRLVPPVSSMLEGLYVKDSKSASARHFKSFFIVVLVTLSMSVICFMNSDNLLISFCNHKNSYIYIFIIPHNYNQTSRSCDALQCFF